MYCYIAPILLTFIGLCSAGPAIAPFFQNNGLVAGPIDPQESFRPYEYGYELGDGLGMTQHRREVADGTGALSWSYGYLDPLGVSRVVEYKADHDGFKAVVKTNEPGVAGQNAADAVFVVQPPPPAAIAQGLRRLLPIVNAETSNYIRL